MRNKIIIKMIWIWCIILFNFTIGHWLGIQLLDFIQYVFKFSDGFMLFVEVILAGTELISSVILLLFIIDPEIFD